MNGHCSLTFFDSQIHTKIISRCNNTCILTGIPFFRIPTFAFHSMKLTMLTRSYMPRLKVIEKQSFQNLEHLVTLQLHDNSEFVNIDRNKFVNCSRLKNVYPHNNRLKRVSSVLKDSLSSLKTPHLYNNELECDCNAMWMKQENMKEKSNRCLWGFLVKVWITPQSQGQSAPRFTHLCLKFHMCPCNHTPL